jgi:hypothetical protein
MCLPTEVVLYSDSSNPRLLTPPVRESGQAQPRKCVECYTCHHYTGAIEIESEPGPGAGANRCECTHLVTLVSPNRRANPGVIVPDCATMSPIIYTPYCSMKSQLWNWVPPGPGSCTWVCPLHVPSRIQCGGTPPLKCILACWRGSPRVI